MLWCNGTTAGLGYGELVLGSWHDILVRIPIRRSMPLTDGSGSRSSFISSLTFKTPTKNYFFYFFCLLLFKDKKSKRSRNSRNQGFSLHFCLIKDPDPYLWLTDSDPDPGGQKTYGSATLQKLPPGSKFVAAQSSCGMWKVWKVAKDRVATVPF